MTDLVEFLRARLDEDCERAEFVKRQIANRPPETFEQWKLSWHDEYDLLCIEPERALAEVEAKRRIIDWAIEFMEGDYAPWNVTCLRLLALPYADHPDYQEEWNV